MLHLASMWLGARVHLPLLRDVPSLVSHTILADIEHLTPILFLSDFVHLPVLLLGEFCEDECSGHSRW